MADFVISPLVDHLVSHAFEKIDEEVKQVKNVKQNVENLKMRLRSIQALLKDAERKQIDSEIIKLWLSKLEETSFRVDNVLDGWNSDILKAQIEKEQREDDESVAHPNKKVRLSVLSSFFGFKQVLDHREIAKKVKELNEELDAILEETSRLGILAAAVEQSQQQKASLSLLKPKLTTSLVDANEIHGRDEIKKTLIGKLLCESSHGENVELISIVGTGGLGKTTLAQLAFNDEKIETSFNKRIWVCVSKPFEQVKIAKVIIEGLGEKAQSDTTLDALLRRIRDMVKEQKFLLVLDDVWTKEREDWRQLEHALGHGGAGSRILVTTRNQEVAIMMKAETRMIPLDLLSEECCWSIIKQLAVEGRERDQAKVAGLEKIGREIARKCKGLPLIATTLGSLLCFKDTKSEWEGILHNKLWESQKDLEKFYAPFLLSYYDLSLSERCCLSYCSIFPKDYQIERDRLIGMWMSQGYFSSGREGKEHFKSLCMRSLFQDIQKSEWGQVYCKMHDIVHDFVQYLTKGKFSVINVDDVEGEMELLENVRHLTIIREFRFSGFSVLKFNEKNRENMRSLIVKCSGGDEFLISSEPASYEGFPNCSHLRTLGLGNLCCEELPESITAMRHLRYLDLSYNMELRELPESLCDLCNLQTLKLDGCYILKRLPKGIGKLVNLRNLYIRHCFRMREGLPKGIRKLRSLEKLDWFVIPSKEKREEYFDVGDFNELKCLQYQESLEITQVGNLENTDEAKKINLENMEDLVYLKLEFGNDNSDPQHQITILEALKPHPYLETLTIVGYKGHPTCSPKWLTSLVLLKRLALWRCVYCEIFPPLGKLLPSLESLDICGWKSVKKVGHELLGIEEGKRKDPSQSSFVSFPKLKQLSFWDMDEWKEWEGSIPEDGSLQVMPSLRILELGHCEKLEGLPDFLRMIRLPTLSIRQCKILKQGCQKGTGKEWLKISHIPNIEIDISSSGSKMPN